MLKKLPVYGSLICLVLLITFAIPAQQKEEGKKYALLIGVQKYGGKSKLRDLKYIDQEIEDLESVLEKQGFSVVSLTRSKSIKADEDFLRPTATNIKDYLNRLRVQVGPKDTLLVAMTGHGAHLKKTDKLYYCPLECKLDDEKSLVSIEEIMQMLGPWQENEEGAEKSTGCRAQAKILFVDACRNEPADGLSGDKPVELKSDTRPLIPEPLGGTVALFSCKKGERSFESEKNKRSFMFHYLIEGLKGEAKDSAGRVHLLRLANYVAEEVPTAVLKEKGPDIKQTPEIIGNIRGTITLAKYDVEKTPPKVVQKEPEPKSQDHAEGEKEESFKYMIDGEEKKGKCRVRTFDLGGGVKLEMVRIGKGKFTMGSPKGEEGHLKDEEEHDEKIEKDFYMGKYEVTQEQYEAIMEKNPSNFKGKKLPVEQVSWKDAKEYCEKLSKKTEIPVESGFRLPLEKEWEYACRAGTRTPFHFGTVLNGDLANCNGNYPYGTETKGKYLEKPSEVGSYPANPWGLYDMHGNVWEWCEDLYSKESVFRVLRGGSWYFYPEWCRASLRYRREPSNRDGNLGFRLCFPLD